MQYSSVEINKSVTVLKSKITSLLCVHYCQKLHYVTDTIDTSRKAQIDMVT